MFILSSLNRNILLEKLSSESFDLLVIGGGITGAGIALDGASRGIKTALIEKQDFASGTSSRSTKLIHGGLRYLKNFEFGLVQEVGHEREIAYRNAPHLVIPEKMLLPLVKGGTYGEMATSFGLFVYDMLAGVKMGEWRKMLSKEETLKEEPLLRSDILQGGGLYTEYRTDDARLTLEVIKTAAKSGAVPLNYLEAKNFIYENQKVSGVECEDVFTKKIIRIKAKQVVNAAGPWVDKVRANDHSLSGKRLHLTKGVHIVVSKKRLPLRHSVYFDTEDGRMIFAIPRGNISYIGTTDTDYSGNIENPLVTNEDCNYLLKAAANMFPSVNLSRSDILSSWCGLRPLIHEEGKSPSELSRKDEIFISQSGLISIAGGKLTGYRKMAEKIVQQVGRNLNIFVSCKTSAIKICGGEFDFPGQVVKYIDEISEKIKMLNLNKYFAGYLVRTYGKQTDVILEKFSELVSEGNLKKDINDNEIYLAKAELWFGVNNESVQKLQDFFIRRTGRLFFEPASVQKLLYPIANEMKNYFNWDEKKLLGEIKEMEILLKQSVTFE